MKELDFDELDRAVNSLMADVKPSGTAASDENEVNTLSIPASDPPADPASSAATNSTNGALPARRSGRFMDMVHPSADMKKSNNPSTPSSGEMIVSPAPKSESMPLPTTAVLPTQQEVQATPGSASTSDWPDPLDVPTLAKDKAPEAPPESTLEPSSAPAIKEETSPSEASEPLAAPSTEDEPQPPLTSPFLPDAKVEKRPLGSQAAPTQPTPASSPLGQTGLTVDNPDDQLPPTPKDVEPPLPEELQNDLVAIEAGASTSPPNPQAEIPASITSSGSKDDKAKESPIHTGPVSIPQQYKEEHHTDPEQPGTIYDTDTYHQPLSHPAKKKSGWLWVVWIVLIVLLGAGVGAALYLFGIISF